jgi:hypothetical protein
MKSWTTSTSSIKKRFAANGAGPTSHRRRHITDVTSRASRSAHLSTCKREDATSVVGLSAHTNTVGGALEAQWRWLAPLPNLPAASQCLPPLWLAELHPFPTHTHTHTRARCDPSHTQCVNHTQGREQSTVHKHGARNERPKHPLHSSSTFQTTNLTPHSQPFASSHTRACISI